MGVSGSASALSADERLQPLLDPDELLARAAGSGAACLSFLDFAPIVIVSGHDSAGLKNALEARGAWPVARAAWRHGGGNLIRDLITVGPVGADGAGGTAPGPA